jgi:hypothetical protein
MDPTDASHPAHPCALPRSCVSHLVSNKSFADPPAACRFCASTVCLAHWVMDDANLGKLRPSTLIKLVRMPMLK